MDIQPRNAGEKWHTRSGRLEAKNKEEPKTELVNVSTGELFLTDDYSVCAMGESTEGWYVDSESSKHMSYKKECFNSMQARDPDSKVTAGDSQTCPVKV